MCVVGRQHITSNTLIENSNISGAFIAHLSYHLARLVGYTTLGAAAGSFGALFLTTPQTAQLQNWFGISAGVVIVIWGLMNLGVLNRLSAILSFGGLTSRLDILASVRASLTKRALALSGALRGALIGLLSSVLPCGWLYAFVIAAAATQNWIAGAVTMAAFWAGTVPALFGFAALLAKIDRRFLSQAPKITAAMMIVIGLLSINGKLLPQYTSGADVPNPLTCHTPSQHQH